jgi:hypothetical protein
MKVWRCRPTISYSLHQTKVSGQSDAPATQDRGKVPCAHWIKWQELRRTEEFLLLACISPQSLSYDTDWPIIVQFTSDMGTSTTIKRNCRKYQKIRHRQLWLTADTFRFLQGSEQARFIVRAVKQWFATCRVEARPSHWITRLGFPRVLAFPLLPVPFQTHDGSLTDSGCNCSMITPLYSAQLETQLQQSRIIHSAHCVCNNLYTYAHNTIISYP